MGELTLEKLISGGMKCKENNNTGNCYCVGVFWQLCMLFSVNEQ